MELSQRITHGIALREYMQSWDQTALRSAPRPYVHMQSKCLTSGAISLVSFTVVNSFVNHFNASEDSPSGLCDVEKKRGGSLENKMYCFSLPTSAILSKGLRLRRDEILL